MNELDGGELQPATFTISATVGRSNGILEAAELQAAQTGRIVAKVAFKSVAALGGLAGTVASGGTALPIIITTGTGIVGIVGGNFDGLFPPDPEGGGSGGSPPPDKTPPSIEMSAVDSGSSEEFG